MDPPAATPAAAHPRTPANERSPVLVAVDDDASALARIEHELQRRYGSDYRVICDGSAPRVLERLQEMRDEGDAVAVVLAEQWMPEMTGTELLTRVRTLHPDAKRALLIEFGAWGDRPTADAVLRAMALGQIDYYVIKPWRTPDELFHRTVAEFVHEWSRAADPGPREIMLVAPRWGRRSHELRSLLARNGVPHRVLESESPEGRRALAAIRLEDRGVPVAIMLTGEVLVDPSNAALATAYGVPTQVPEDRDFDVVVVGSGPGGLATAVYGASEGLRTLGVERESIGGQAGSSSLIRNFLGFPRGVSGAELAQRAYQQAWVFGAHFLLMCAVTGLRVGAERHVVALADGSEVTARAVVLATGVSYRRLDIPALNDRMGSGVFYGASVSEAQAVEGARVFVVGGGNSAGQAAMHLARHAERVTILVRGGSLAETMSSYLIGEIAAAPNVEVRTQVEVVDGAGDGRLEQLSIRDRVTGDVAAEPAEALFVLIGARPHTEWLPDAVARDRWGFVITGRDLDGLAAAWPLDRAPLPLEASVPGVFAVGDVRHASVKRVASAVGEGSVVIRHALEAFAHADEAKRPAQVNAARG
jgi:thioredoxin reductase (NADPH)